MSDHITEWLGAYHDGELHGARLRQVEAHLAECATCQAGLEEIRDLSTLLQDTAADGDFLSAERFVANLTLSLPRQSAEPQPREALKIGWWLIPVALLGVWLFINITLSLSSLATFAADTGLLNGNLAWLQDNHLQMEWFAAVMNLYGNQLGALERETLSALNDTNLVMTQLAERLIPQAILAAAYLGWLLTWWLRRPANPGESSHPDA